jgi:hypothetical protein
MQIRWIVSLQLIPYLPKSPCIEDRIHTGKDAFHAPKDRSGREALKIFKIKDLARNLHRLLQSGPDLGLEKFTMTAQKQMSN